MRAACISRTILSMSIAALMATDLAIAAEAPVVKTDWTGFRREVSKLKLQNRTVWISLATGGSIKTSLLRVEDNALVVKSNRATKQWGSGKLESSVPRDAVSSVRFGGKVGKGGLIGGLVGLGAGAIGTAVAASSGGTCEGSSCGGVVILIPLGAIGGYFLGHAKDKPAPVFLIQP